VSDPPDLDRLDDGPSNSEPSNSEPSNSEPSNSEPSNSEPSGEGLGRHGTGDTAVPSAEAAPAEAGIDASQPPESQPPESQPPESQPPESQPPTARRVLDYLLYTVSLPERAVRGASAVVAGTLRESAELLIPQAFRSSKSYNVFVQQMLDFMATDIGGVKGEAEPGDPQVEGYVARKTVGGFVDMAGLATLHLSPITILAVMTDVAYGSKQYLRELADELKREGIIAEDSTVSNLSDLLNEVGNASGTTAEALDMPPLSVEALKDTIAQTREALSGIDVREVFPQAELDRMWAEIRGIADREHVSLLGASSALSMYAMNRVTTVGRGALSTVRVAGNMFDQHILEHYEQGLKVIHEQGYYQFLSAASGPYIEAVWLNFSSQRETITEDVVRGKFFVRWWRWGTSWLRRDA
jgi:hypothetical protein